MSMVGDRGRQTLTAHAEADVQIELTHAVFRGLLPTVIISGIGTVGTTMLLADHYHDFWLWNIALIISAAACLRAGVVISFNLRDPRTLSPESALSWSSRYGFSIVVYCSTLAISTLYNFSHHDVAASNICTLGIFMFCAAVGGRMGLGPVYTHLCVFILLAALAISLWWSYATLLTVEIFLMALFGYANFVAVEGKHAVLLDQLRSKRQLQVLTEQDTLTGLANRRYFEELLATACHLSTPFALLFIDLDRFKQVNDTYGHGVGDQVLKGVAARLRAAVRDGDLIARLGGDEFAILQYSFITSTCSEKLATRINESLSDPLVIDDHRIIIGASVGIHISNQLEKDPDRLLMMADKALYRVKRSGRGSFALS